MSFFTRSDGPAQLVGSHERCPRQPTSTQPELDRPMRTLIDDQSDHYHQKQKRQKKNPRGCFRVAWFAETPNFAQQQTQVVGGTFQRVRFDHILLATQPSPPSAPGLTDMSEGSLASLASPPIQAPSLLCTHSSSVGPKGGLVSRRFVDPTPNLLSPLRDVSAHLPFGTPSQQAVIVITFVHHHFGYRVGTSRQHHVGLRQTQRNRRCLGIGFVGVRHHRCHDCFAHQRS